MYRIALATCGSAASAQIRPAVDKLRKDWPAMDDTAVDGADELARLREENDALRRQLELNRTAYDYLVRLAHHFSGEEASFEDAGQIRAFCERIKRSVGVLVHEFKELLSGRKRFQLEYALHSNPTQGGAAQAGTQIIRLGDLHGELGRFLFDWKSTEPDSEKFRELRTAIDELKHHQMAILAGFEYSLKDGTLETMKTIAPETIEEDILPQAGVMKVLAGLNPWASRRMWRVYKKKYSELATEDSGWYQTRFLPSFRHGYRQYMYAKNAQPSTANQGET